MAASTLQFTNDGRLSEIPPQLRDALKKLASHSQAGSIRRLLEARIQLQEEDGAISFDPPRLTLDDSWSSGTTHFERLDKDQAWEATGHPGKMPFMVERLDPTGGRTYWTEDGRRWLEEKNEDGRYVNGVEFNLQWHQIVGVLRMLEIGFEGK